MESGGAGMARAHLVDILKSHGHIEVPEPVQLASGDWSRHFIDAKRALARGQHLELAIEVLLDVTHSHGHSFDALGGLTMGADQFAHALVMLRPEVEWFSVRKEAKGRGTRRRIEGAVLGPGRQVLVVDDVVTRGGSIVEAYHEVTQTGATVVCAVGLVDRGGGGGDFFAQQGVAYHSLVTHDDLGIPAVGTEPGLAAASSLIDPPPHITGK